MQKMTATKTLLTTFAALAFSAGSAFADVSFDDDDSEIPDDDDLEELVSRTLDLPSFHGIDLEASMALEITLGEEQSVTLMTEEDHFENLEFSVEDGILEIEHDDHRGDAHVKMIITMTAFDYFRMDETVIDAEFSDIHSEEFELDIEGIGAFDMDGSCEILRFDIKGVGDFDLSDFECQNAKGDIAGVGNFSIYADESIVLDASGIGDITIYGDPDIRDVSAVGLGDVDYD